MATAAAMVWQWPWQALAALGRELAADWETQDMRATLCKLLLLWLVISMLGICLAWRAYGETVAALCYRTGPAARRSPDTGPGPSPARPRAHSLSPASPAGRNDVGDWHCASREGSMAELAKTHQE